MARLVLVRHGETTGSSSIRFWGKTDVELSPRGVKQAELLAGRLAGEKYSAIYASTLCRARKTAETIATPHRLAVMVRAELAEIDFGELEGLTFDEISQRHPEQAKAIARCSLPPAFPGGESLDDLNRRVCRFLDTIQQHGEEEKLLIVAHAGVLRLLLCNLLGIDLKHWRQFRIDLASLSILETYGQYAILSSLNDTSHLAD